MTSEKPKVLLVTEQALLGECLISALSHYDVYLEDSIANIRELSSEVLNSFAAAVLHVDTRNTFSPSETQEIVTLLGETRVIVFGNSKEEAEVVNYLEAGAFDYRVTESESVKGFCQAIDDAVSGEISYGPERTKAIFDRLQRLSAEVRRINEIDTSILTPRELEILRLIESGRTNAEIAVDLYLSLHTVKNHVHNMLSKLSCKNRREAVHMAYTNGWIKVESTV